MKTIKLLNQWVGIGVSLAIGLGSALPVFAQAEPTPQPSATPAPQPTESPSPAPADAAPPSAASGTLCRAANRPTPVFQSASTTSAALRIVAEDGQVTLTSVPASGSQFAQINAPVAGFVQTAVLKQCGTTSGNLWDKPTTGTVCRRAIRPTQLNIRREPTTKNSNVITTITTPKTVYITTTTGGVVKSYRAEDYDWVQVDLAKSLGSGFSGYGWMFNTDLQTNPNLSNLVLCQ